MQGRYLEWRGDLFTMRAYEAPRQPSSLELQEGSRPIYTMQLTVVASIKRFHPMAVYRSLVRKRFRHLLRSAVSDDPSAFLLDRHVYVIHPSQRSLRIEQDVLAKELLAALTSFKVNFHQSPVLCDADYVQRLSRKS
jgi:RNase P protein component